MAAGYKVRGITIEINADTAGVIDGLKEIDKSLATANRALRDTERLLKLDPTNVTLLSQRQDYLNSAIEDTAKKLEKEKELLEKLQNGPDSDKTTEQQNALARQIEDTTMRMEKYKSELDKTKDALNGVSQGTEKAETETKKYTDIITQLSRLEFFGKISDEAKELVEAMTECVEVSTKFETSMAKIETLAHAGDGLGKMADEIKKNAQSIGVSATNLGEAVYQAMSAGVDQSHAIEFAANATRLAIGGFTEAATTVDIVTTALNAYGLEMEDSGHIMDNLITTQNLGKTTVDELAASMGKVIPTASAYNVNIDNLAAAYAELTAKGIKTKISTTDLNAMLSELGDSSKDVNAIIQELSGQTFGQFMAEGNSLADVMKLLWEYAGEDKEAFYGLWSQSAAATAAFNIASDGGARFNEILAEMKNNAGAADEAFGIMAETSEMLDERFQATADNFKMAIGDALIPILDQVKEVGMEALEPVTEFIEAHPELVRAIAGMTAGIVGATTALTALAAIVTVFSLLSGHILQIAAVLGTGALVGGVAALALGMEEGATSAAQLNYELNKTVENLNASTQKYGQNTEEVEKLARTIKNLNSIEKLEGEQKTDLAVAVEKWNSMMDVSNQLILDNTGHIEGNTEAIARNIEMAYKEYELAQKQEEAKEILEAYIEAKEALAEADLRVAEAENALAEASKMNESYYDECIIKVNAEKDARDQLQSTVEQLSIRYDELTGSLDENSNAQEENNSATEEGTRLTAAQQEELDKLVEKYQNAVEAARSSLEGQREAFENLFEGTHKTTEQIAEDLKKQAEGMTEYANLIAEAYQIMQQNEDAEGILEYYISKGPDAAKELDNLVEACKNGASSFDEAVASFNETQTLLDTISEMTGAIETGYLEPMEGLIDSLGENFEQINEAFSENYSTQLESAEEHSTAMTEAQTGTVTGMTQAVTDNAPALAAAHKQMMEDCIKEAKNALGYDEATGRSTKFYELGMKIDQSVADGILDNMGVVAAALQSCVDNAIESLDFSAISAKINSALGAAFG
ncbi:MAG: phage tail tape measure protein [Lachnospiraceae bacterium]|nr:phage tail tape measure protein [Lachnospiraceae bacterium]